MTTKRNNAYTLSSKPCDIEYRLTRVYDLADRLSDILSSIDPTALPPGALDKMKETVGCLFVQASEARGSAPSKRPHSRRGDALPAAFVTLAQQLDALDDALSPLDEEAAQLNAEFSARDENEVLFVEEEAAAE